MLRWSAEQLSDPLCRLWKSHSEFAKKAGSILTQRLPAATHAFRDHCEMFGRENAGRDAGLEGIECCPIRRGELRVSQLQPIANPGFLLFTL